MLQSHLVSVDPSNLLRDIVPLVLHGRLQNVAVDVRILEGKLQLLVRLLGASLELVQLLNKHLDVLRHLSFKGASCLSIFSSNSMDLRTQYAIAARNGNLARVKYFLNRGVNVNTRHDPDQTALALAAGSGHNHVVKHLINKGATINSRDRLGMTPLMRAVVGGRERVVQTLLDAGASINAKSTSGMTPLAYAVLWNRKSVVRLLLDLGARVNLRNAQTKRALNMSSNNNIKRMVLIPRGVVGFFGAPRSNGSSLKPYRRRVLLNLR